MWRDSDNDNLDYGTTELIKKFAPYCALLGLLAGGLFCYSNFYTQKRRAEKLQTRFIAAIVSQKYIDKRDHNYKRIYLRYANEDIYFSGSSYFYDSLQVGDSLYKPADSTYFFRLEHQGGIRMLHELRNN